MAEVPEEAQAAAAEEILEAQAEVPEEAEAGIQEVPEAAAETERTVEVMQETVTAEMKVHPRTETWLMQGKPHPAVM